MHQKGHQWRPLCGDWPTYGGGQKSHFHPQITPDRKWILLTAGDPKTKTNHMFLLDASDLKEVAAITPEKLSPTGEHDMTRRNLPKDLVAAALSIKSVTTSGFQPDNRPENSFDGDLSTLWAAEGAGQWIRYDLGEVKPIGRVLISWYSGDRRKQRYEVAVSDDAQQWRVVFDGSSSGTVSGPEPCKLRPTTARYVRITGHGNTANTWNSMGEFLLLAE